MFNIDLNNNLISRYRSQLMGFATVMILICHASAHIEYIPSMVKSALSYCSIGVDIFLVLSGFGLFFSLENNKSNIVLWYYKRYARLIVPCFLVQVLFVDNEGVLDFLKFTFGISFWESHSGFWFVDLLFILYLIYPILYHCVIAEKLLYDVVIVVLCALIYILPIMFHIDEGLLGNLLSVCPYIPSFVIGAFLARSSKSGVLHSYNKILIVCYMICLILIVAKSFTHFSLYLGLPMSITIIIIAILFFESIGLNNCKLLTFFGGISLESYIINVSLPFFLKRQEWFVPIDDGLFYLMIIGGGTFIAVLVNYISKIIINKFLVK